MNRKRICAIFVFALVLILGMLFALGNGRAVEPTLGTVRLNIETYRAGKNQATHPSVVIFPEPWNGWEYWMAYSPYPYANGEEENPCIAVSHDMFYWDTPYGLANPVADNEETGCDELKDPHLVYREDLDRLEMWYLGRLSENLGGDGYSLLLMRKYSYDGITWSDYEIMTSTRYLSPSILWDGTKYRMWGIGYDSWNTEGIFSYQESIDGFSWSDPVNCFIDEQNEGIDIWHGSVTSHNGVYHCTYIDDSDKQEVFCCNSLDGIHFSKPEVIVQNDGYWRNLYRPTLVYCEDSVYCIYGVVNQANQWYISMSVGQDEHNLVGIGKADREKMRPIPDDTINTHSVGYHLKEVYNAAQQYIRFELFAIIFAEMALLYFRKTRGRQGNPCWWLTCLNTLLFLTYIGIRMQPGNLKNWLGATLATVYMNIGISGVLLCQYIILFKGYQNETKSA